jgi:predicted phage tail protein
MLLMLAAAFSLIETHSTMAVGEDALPPDTTPPAPIAGLLATDAHDGKVILNWSISKEQDLAYYAIYSSNDFFLTVMNRQALIKLADIATGNFTVIGLSDGVQYFFAVTAVDKNGNENRTVVSVSCTPTASVVPDTTAPPAVTGITAADARDGKVNLTWVPVNVTDFSYYSIYVATQAGASVENLTPALKMADMAMGRMTLTGLNDSKTYYFAVTAVDKTGNENKTVPATVSATSTASSPGTTSEPVNEEGPEAVSLVPYQVITGLLIVAVAALVTFKILAVVHKPPESDMESLLNGNEGEQDEPEEEVEDDGK